MSGKQVIERTWDAPIELIWELWSTPDGLASWWGPGGFTVEVHEMDLRVGGAYRYTMRASSPESIAMMEKRGRPASWSVDATYTAVEPMTRMAWDSPMGPETLMTSVTFTQTDTGVAMVLVIDASKPEMTGGAAMGWRSSLKGFEARLAAAQA